MNLRSPAMAVLGLALLTACDRSDDPVEAPVAAAPVAVPAPVAPAAPDGAADLERPALTTTLLDGTAYDLADHRGKWVVVNFWATWCSPCLKEMPELSALDAMREDVEVIGLAYEEIDVADMRAFLDKHPVVYPIAIVDTYDPPADFETPRGLPMTVLIAPDGRVVESTIGGVTAASLEAAIARHGGTSRT